MAHPDQNETVIVHLDTAPGTDAPAAAPPPSPDAGAPGNSDGRLYGGQFKTVEELEAAYASLNAPKDDAPANGTGPATIDDAPDDEEVADALTRAGLDMATFNEEFASAGTLSAESYAKLEQAGFPKDLVDVYVDGLKARVQSFEASVYAPVGGKDGYTALIQWAKSNVSDEHKRVFNEAIQSGDQDRAALAVQALIALRGGAGRLLNGKTTSAPQGVQPYGSQAQAVAAARDPRYRTDPAYRADHEARLSLSPLFT